MSRHFGFVYSALGLYPGIAAQDPEGELKRLEILVEEFKPAAIGEIGLDYHWNYGTPDLQRHLFASQIRLANRFSLPVIIHTRNADRDTASVLKATPPNRGGILHCFSSDWDFACVCLDLGLFISFAGNLTYKKSDSLRDTAIRLPAESLLVETDSPYLAPDGRRGKTNTPLFIPAVYDILADIRGVKMNHLIDDVNRNFFNLLGEYRKK